MLFYVTDLVPLCSTLLTLKLSGFGEAFGPFVAEELARVRKVFEEEQLARESFHQEQEQTKIRMESLRKNAEASKKEAEKYKGWLEGIRKENRMCKVR